MGGDLAVTAETDRFVSTGYAEFPRPKVGDVFGTPIEKSVGDAFREEVADGDSFDDYHVERTASHARLPAFLNEPAGVADRHSVSYKRMYKYYYTFDQ